MKRLVPGALQTENALHFLEVQRVFWRFCAVFQLKIWQEMFLVIFVLKWT
ncbi:hypothetical protein B1R32_11435 [Abditibacterium utsteinense]|uniref:Uncharacterized protein n=1 Tax=Abditibacterium utsteinense TaxID=1960156 RepID=A0A2S8SQZ2_9BACT|nr:hypothetical protein B1R32_11435 [Abditibacterium utsteinense]